MNMTIQEMRAFYGKRYKKIIDALEQIGVEKVNVYTEFGIHLEFECYPIKNDRYKHLLWMNIGINDCYNTTYGSEYSWIDREPHRHSYRSQNDAARFIRIIGGLEQEPRYYIGDRRMFSH